MKLVIEFVVLFGFFVVMVMMILVSFSLKMMWIMIVVIDIGSISGKMIF